MGPPLERINVILYGQKTVDEAVDLVSLKDVSDFLIAAAPDPLVEAIREGLAAERLTLWTGHPRCYAVMYDEEGRGAGHLGNLIMDANSRPTGQGTVVLPPEAQPDYWKIWAIYSKRTIHQQTIDASTPR